MSNYIAPIWAGVYAGGLFLAFSWLKKRVHNGPEAKAAGGTET